jgi:hypothetical protein
MKKLHFLIVFLGICFIGYITWFLFWPGYDMGRAKSFCQSLLPDIEGYKRDTGTYPDTLETIGVSVTWFTPSAAQGGCVHGHGSLCGYYTGTRKYPDVNDCNRTNYFGMEVYHTLKGCELRSCIGSWHPPS